MKISTLVATALLAVAPAVNALPAPESFPVSEAAQRNPVEGRDIHEGPIILGAGYLQERHMQRLEKRNTDSHRVEGVRKGYSGNYRVYRQEIRKFRNDQGGRVHDLFLLALNRMYQHPASDWNSYWQLAGIHGRPFQNWVNDPSSGVNPTGYCTHSSTLFPTWHRPYLAYFEEVVWANAEYIVNNVVVASQRQKWRDALMVLRLPYWDWALDGGIPDVFRAPIWEFRYWPDGRTKVKQPNPLYAANLSGKPYSTAFAGPFTQWSDTKRYPNYGSGDPTAANAQSNNDQAQLVMSRANGGLRSRVYQLLMNNNQWGSFSNTDSGNSNFPDSLESIHNSIHGNVGGTWGHMTYVDHSSFDPIFFIHHANVDRLFAIWQAINPTTYVSAQRNNGGTYGVPRGTVESRTSVLRPFRGLSGGYWTSDGVRDTSLFGYGYYETPKWKYSKATESEYARTVRNTVNTLYGSQSFSAASSNLKMKRDLNGTEAGIAASIIGNQYYEWRIDIKADKSAANGTYNVYFFLGKPSKNPLDWPTQKEYVGTYTCFTHDHVAPPGMDASMVDTMVTGAVPLTEAMVGVFANTELNSTNPDDNVSEFLIKNLRWRATGPDGKRLRLKTLKGLQVSISINLATLPTEETPWTQYSETWEHLTDITKKIGKDGGPDKVNIIPDLVSSIIPAPTSSTDIPTTTSAPAVEEATTTSEAVTADATTSAEATTTSSEAPDSTETST